MNITLAKKVLTMTNKNAVQEYSWSYEKTAEKTYILIRVTDIRALNFSESISNLPSYGNYIPNAVHLSGKLLTSSTDDQRLPEMSIRISAMRLEGIGSGDLAILECYENRCSGLYPCPEDVSPLNFSNWLTTDEGKAFFIA